MAQICWFSSYVAVPLCVHQKALFISLQDSFALGLISSQKTVVGKIVNVFDFKIISMF